MATEFVELQLPMLEKPYKYTGEYRYPQQGEYYLVEGNTCLKRSAHVFKRQYPIIEREPWVPAWDDNFFMISESGEVQEVVLVSDYMKQIVTYGNYFKTQELAETARDKLVELLKGCAHE